MIANKWEILSPAVRGSWGQLQWIFGGRLPACSANYKIFTTRYLTDD